MTLKEWVKETLISDSLSTNPWHKSLTAMQKLQSDSEILSEDQYQKCKAFIENNFDESKLDESQIV